MAFHVLMQNLDELGDDVVALERGEQAAIDVDRGFGFFEGAGQGNAEAGVFGFAGAPFLARSVCEKWGNEERYPADRTFILSTSQASTLAGPASRLVW